MSLSASICCKVNVEFWHDCFSNLGSTPEEYDKWVVVLEVTQIFMKIDNGNMQGNEIILA